MAYTCDNLIARIANLLPKMQYFKDEMPFFGNFCHLFSKTQ